jgi:Flp pilus assembly pilin Flp
MRNTLLWRLLTDEAGEVAISYALIAALISIAAIIGFGNLGMSSAELYKAIAAAIESKG